MKLLKFTGRTQSSRQDALRRTSPNPDSEYLLHSLQSAKMELHEANTLFNQLTDEEAIDYASYNLLAARTKYSYLLKLAKEKQISL